MKTYKDLPKWDGKTPPKSNEYLLKVDYGTGFATKLTLKGELPIAFINWADVPIYVLKEEPKYGWTIAGYRSGKSQDWGKIKHPLGFNLEVYLGNLFEIIKNFQIYNGKIEGLFAWEYSKLLTSEQWETKNQFVKEDVPRTIVKMKDLIPGHIYATPNGDFTRGLFNGAYYILTAYLDSSKSKITMHYHKKYLFENPKCPKCSIHEYSTRTVYDTGNIAGISYDTELKVCTNLAQYNSWFIQTQRTPFKNKKSFITPGTNENTQLLEFFKIPKGTTIEYRKF